MTDLILEEAKRLHALGWGILWLYPKEKRPINSGWTTGERESWKALQSNYHKGYNVGVRLGEPSRIDDHYLACIDVDIKDKDPKSFKAALDLVLNLIGEASCPEVHSGSGNGSRHLYFVSKVPFKMITAGKEKGKWEVVIYSSGRQMVLPPSVHPNGRRYKWAHRGELPLFDFSHLSKEEKPDVGEEKTKKKTLTGIDNDLDFDFDESLDVRWLPDLSEEVRAAIVSGAGVTDRSDYLLRACHALVTAGLGRHEILTVLTDPSLYLGQCAYDHAQTKSRLRAAQWVWKYTLQRVMKERDPVLVFKDRPITRNALLKDGAKSLEDERPWQQDLKKTDKGKTANCLANVYLILKKCFGPKLFRFNQFSKHDEIWEKTPWGAKIGEEFQERDIQKIKLWMANHFGFQPTDDNIWAALINIADENAYHPIKEYFLSLPPHDGVERVDFFLEKYLRGEAPLKYMRAVSRKTIVAMVARIFEPGIKFDTMLVLEGVQGLRKSTAIATLASKAWFTDVNLNLKHKDSIADMSGKWVLEQGEMNVMNAHDIAELKQFLSRDTDRMRPSYGRKSQDYPRQSIFIGTTNENIYLKDTTGSRRFWPVKVTGDCDISAITKDRDQIFAEALAMYRAGEPIWISDKETNHLALAQQAERETEDELISVIADWIQMMCNKSDFKDPFDDEKIKISDFFVTGGPFVGNPSISVKMDMYGQKRVGECLRKLGYERKLIRENDRPTRFWVKCNRKNDESNPSEDVEVTENYE